MRLNRGPGIRWRLSAVSRVRPTSGSPKRPDADRPRGEWPVHQAHIHSPGDGARYPPDRRSSAFICLQKKAADPVRNGRKWPTPCVAADGPCGEARRGRSQSGKRLSATFGIFAGAISRLHASLFRPAALTTKSPLAAIRVNSMTAEVAAPAPADRRRGYSMG